MSNDIMKRKDINEEMALQKSKFKGYTLEQIRYQRAVVALQQEFTKEKIVSDINRLQNRGIFGSKGENTPKWAKVGNLVGRIAGGLNYLDYAMVGVSVFSVVRKVARLFRK